MWLWDFFFSLVGAIDGLDRLNIEIQILSLLCLPFSHGRYTTKLEAKIKGLEPATRFRRPLVNPTQFQ